jgi:hypothetical protein
MSCKCEEEFNPWPSFVDIFSSVILVLLLFLLVVLANLGYYAQFKYKVSFNGSISTDELITTTSSSANTTETKTSSGSPTSNPNSDINVQIIKEQKQMILALQTQLSADPTNIKSAQGSDEVESAGINVSDKKEDSTVIQKMVAADEYLIITYKADELFVDDVISKQLKEFLTKAKGKYPAHQVNIYSSDIKDQLSSTISKQISLARTMSVRNLIKKFGYEKKDIKIDLASKAEVKEAVDAKNGYLVIKIIK